MPPTGTKRRYSDTYGVKQRKLVFVLILLSLLTEAKVLGYNAKQSTWTLEWWKNLSRAGYIRYKSEVTSSSVLITVLLTDRPTDRPANRPNDSKTKNRQTTEILKIVVKQKISNVMQNSTIHNNTSNWKLFMKATTKCGLQNAHNDSQNFYFLIWSNISMQSNSEKNCSTRIKRNFLMNYLKPENHIFCRRPLPLITSST